MGNFILSTIYGYIKDGGYTQTREEAIKFKTFDDCIAFGKMFKRFNNDEIVVVSVIDENNNAINLYDLI